MIDLIDSWLYILYNRSNIEFRFGKNSLKKLLKIAVLVTIQQDTQALKLKPLKHRAQINNKPNFFKGTFHYIF